MRIKKKYLANFNRKDIIDNKTFWQTVRHFLSEKLKSREKITLVEKEELVLSESDVAKLFNQFLQILSKILIYLNTWMGILTAVSTEVSTFKINLMF